MRLSREFELVAACCRRPADAALDARIRALAGAVDWRRVAAIAARHRVEGLAWDGLRRAGVTPPETEAQALREAAGRIARQSLILSGESLRLRRLLEGEGIDVLFLKGVTLGQIAWGSIGVKMGWDIDLLVAPAAVEASAALLEREGYRLIIPEGPGARDKLAFWHAHWKESVWVAERTGITVELHTALTDNPALLGGVGLRSPRQEVAVGGKATLATLATEPLFAYLAIHGASSAWFRLKWIADVGALLARFAPDGIERLYRRAEALGAGRAAALALLLCARLFETPLPPVLASELRRDRATRWMLALSLRKLAGRAEAKELGAVPLGTASVHFLQFGLARGWRFKLGELRRQMVSPYDQVAVPLPRALTFLYPALFLLRRNRR